MLNKITDRIAIILLTIVSIVLCLDLFLHKGATPTTFDAPTHITNMHMFHTSLREGEFPAAWNNTFANYGLPMPLITQQTTSYLGAILIFLVNDPVLAYHLVVFIFTIASAIAMYTWLRIYTMPAYALVGSLLYTVAPYKLVNVYARGALPEFASAVWFPLCAWGMYKLIAQKQYQGIIAIGISVAGLFLTHPMSAVVSAPFLAIYGAYLTFTHYKHYLAIIAAIIAIICGGGISAYYMLPLSDEIKYFLYGTYPSNLKPNEFLKPESFTTWQWPYWSDIPTRGYTLRIGITEQIILIFFVVFSFTIILKRLRIIKFSKVKMSDNDSLFGISLCIVMCYLYFLLPMSLPLYQANATLANIQYPTRMLTGLFTIIPLLTVLLMNVSRKLAITITAIVLLTVIIRVPQAHGKNYLDQPRSEYTYSIKNMHGNFLNTIWMDAPEKYPLRTVQSKIVNGEGALIINNVKNTSRSYTITATTPLQIVDYTFFFPGWKVYANGREIPIEFQDIMYRGLVTYRLEPGQYNVEVKFIQTRIRKIGLLVSGVSLVSLIILTIGWRHIFHQRYQ